MAAIAAWEFERSKPGHGANRRQAGDGQDGAIERQPLAAGRTISNQGHLSGRLRINDGRIQIAPPLFLEDAARLRARTAVSSAELVLIGRRHLHSNSSWCHNAGRLVKGKPRCVLLMNRRDADIRKIADGDRVSLVSRTGRIEVPAEITEDIMPGVVSLPHGWATIAPGSGYGSPSVPRAPASTTLPTEKPSIRYRETRRSPAPVQVERVFLFSALADLKAGLGTLLVH